MEDLIEKAQRSHNQPTNVERSREVERLRRLRDQMFDDVNEFVRQREKYRWRQWDKQRDSSYDKEFVGERASYALTKRMLKVATKQLLRVNTKM